MSWRGLISPLEGEMAAKRPEGVGSTGRDFLRQMEASAPRATTPSVAFGDISPSRGEIRHAAQCSTNSPSTLRHSFGAISFWCV